MGNKAKLTQAGDGTAIPAGFVGEKITSNVSNVNATGVNSVSTAAATLPLTPGTWLITCNVSGGVGVRPTGTGAVSGGFDIYNDTDSSILLLRQFLAHWYTSANELDSAPYNISASHVVTLTGNKNITLRVRCDSFAGAPTGSPTMFCRAQTDGFQAIRIA